MKKDDRLILNDLSKKVYGSMSKWQKMVNKGQVGPKTEKLEDGTERKFKGIVYYSVDEIKKMMEDLWKEELELKAEQEKEAIETKENIKAKEKIEETSKEV